MERLGAFGGGPVEGDGSYIRDHLTMTRPHLGEGEGGRKGGRVRVMVRVGVRVRVSVRVRVRVRVRVAIRK